MEQLAGLLGKGYTVCFGICKGKRDLNHWTEQHVVALDFDNDKENPITIDEVINDEFIKNNALLYYKTFSHIEDLHKFRIVFVLDRVVTDHNEVETIYEYLFAKYPKYIDISCKDGTRLFFGGTDATVINESNVLCVDKILKDFNRGDFVTCKTKGNSVNDSLDNRMFYRSQKPTNKQANNIQAILDDDIDYLRKELNLPIKQFTTKMQALHSYIKKQNMGLLLGAGSSLYDIFHQEETPSASIFQLPSGDWIYKCHSGRYPFTGDVVSVIEKLKGITSGEVIDFLIKVYNIEILESNKIKRIREDVSLIKSHLLDIDFKERYPNTYSIFRRYIKDVCRLLDIISENIYEDEWGNARLISYYGREKLADLVYHSTSKDKKVERLVNLMALTNLLDKTSIQDIPINLLSKLEDSKKRKGHKRIVSVIELNQYNEDFINELEIVCKGLKENNFTMNAFGYEWVLRTLGQDVANKVFPQEANKELPKLNEDLTMYIHRITNILINKHGYTTEKTVLEGLHRVLKNKTFNKTQFKRALQEMLDTYLLERVRLNALLKEKLGIKSEGYPFVIRRIA